MSAAIRVRKGQFTWDGAPPPTAEELAKAKKDAASSPRGPGAPAPPAAPVEVPEEEIFKLRDIDFEIPKGTLCAIVGSVGSGKSSLLQAILGEMRRTGGAVSLNGKISYAAQSAWIQVSLFSHPPHNFFAF